jgi:hypothetical protein
MAARALKPGLPSCPATSSSPARRAAEALGQSGSGAWSESAMSASATARDSRAEPISAPEASNAVAITAASLARPGACAGSASKSASAASMSADVPPGPS